MDSFDYRVVISGHLGSYGNETNRFLRSLRSVEMTLGDCRSRLRLLRNDTKQIPHQVRNDPEPNQTGHRPDWYGASGGEEFLSFDHAQDMVLSFELGGSEIV